MKYIEKHPMIMIVVGVLGISMSAIFVKYSTAPSAMTAAFRLLWTVILMSPVVIGKSTTIVCTEVIWAALGFCIFMKGNSSNRNYLCGKYCDCMW